MDAHDDLAAARIERFLAEEPVVWLSTVRPDGRPHVVPTWFAWDGRALTILSKPGAQKVQNLRAHPEAMLALGDAEADFDVGLVEARVEGLETLAAELPASFAAKYGERIAELGLTTEQFARTYAQLIRLAPTRALGWHGRSQPASVVVAARRVATSRPVSITEPPAERAPGLRAWLGEPLSRGLRSLRPASAPALRPGGVAI